MHIAKTDRMHQNPHDRSRARQRWFPLPPQSSLPRNHRLEELKLAAWATSCHGSTSYGSDSCQGAREKNSRYNKSRCCCKKKTCLFLTLLPWPSTSCEWLLKTCQNRPPGRPLKLPPSEASSDTSARSTKVRKKSKMPSLKNIKSKRDMSPLERLPTELLVEVFLYCMNLNLPRSSPVIGGKLSSESVYTRTILAAFEDTWEEYYKSRKDTPSNRIQGDYKLQVRK